MNKEDILRIQKAGDLFSNNLSECKAEYKELLKIWHPDNNEEDTTAVFLKIKELYEQAIHLIEEGRWEKSNVVEFSTISNNHITFCYKNSFSFELGTCFISSKMIIYQIAADKKKYFDNYIEQVQYVKNCLKKGDRALREEFEKLMPNIYKTHTLTDKSNLIVIKKTEDVYNLNDLHQFFGKRIEDRHVAWMMSRLCNLNCYLNTIGIVHNGINLENCFVSPQFHSILLLGGWWYAVREGEKMIGTTKEIFDIMPVKNKMLKVSSTITDNESIRLCGRRLLGEANCRLLASSNLAPKPILDFLVSAAGDNAYEVFSHWENALMNAYGERKFIHMPIDSTKFYQEIERLKTKNQ